MRVKSKIGKWVLTLIIRGFKFVENGENGEIPRINKSREPIKLEKLAVSI